jgi:hypothetical protein
MFRARILDRKWTFYKNGKIGIGVDRRENGMGLIFFARFRTAAKTKQKLTMAE